MYDPTKNTGYPGPPAYPAQPGYPPTGFAPYGGQTQQYGAGPYGGYPQQGFPGGPPPVIGFQGLGPQDASHGSPFVAGLQQPPQENSSARIDPEANVAGFGGSFGEKAVRQAFVRKVYSILSVQLLFTLGFIALCVFVIDVKLWLRRNIWTYYLSYATFLGTYIALVCCPSVRKNHPTNMIVLAIFTAAMAFMTGMISSFHNTQIVLMAIGITAAVTVAVTLFAMNTKYDVTGCGMFLFIVSLVLMVFGIATMIVFFVDKDAHRIMSLVYGALMALVFSMYLMYDVQQIMGGRKIELSPEEHVYGAIQLYLDIVYIFLAILQISSFFSST